MPLHSKKHINNGIVALWEIKESFDELLHLVPDKWVNGIDLKKLSTHNLAARTLANQVCPEFNVLEKDAYGKPYFESAGNNKISITHSGNFAAFMLKENEECGIDMEQITDRITRISSKFLREDEQAFEKDGLRGLYLVWCAKEALYKYYGLKALDFKSNMKVEHSPVQESGTIYGQIMKNDYNKRIELKYEFMQDYILVHTN